jgi:hypothetical protein
MKERGAFALPSAAGVVALAVSLSAAANAAATPKPDFDVYQGDVSRSGLAKLVALGIDRHEISFSKARSGRDAVHVEVTLNGDQAAELSREGVDMELKEVGGVSAAQRATLQAAAGWTSSPGRSRSARRCSRTASSRPSSTSARTTRASGSRRR